MARDSETIRALETRQLEARPVVEVVTAAGEAMLFLAFLAAGIVLSAGTEDAPVVLDEPMILVVIALTGVGGAGLALGSVRSGRVILENWGANISLLAAVALLFRLYVPIAALWSSADRLSGVDVTPFVAGLLALSVVRTSLVAGRSVLAQLFSGGDERREADWQILRGRWIFIVGLLGILVIVETL